jgi:hypothetical protein
MIEWEGKMGKGKSIVRKLARGRETKKENLKNCIYIA